MVHVSFEHAFGLPWGAIDVGSEGYVAIWRTLMSPRKYWIEHFLLTDSADNAKT